MEVDLLIIGGGINGCGIAADAAGRGLSVLLCEKDDLAYATSSASSKLIHGGLRYLEQHDFKLVRAALKEREILMHKAPFLIRPTEFILPHDPELRRALTLRLGLWVYDHLYMDRSLPDSHTVNLEKSTEGKPLKDRYRLGFSYADCCTDDARLVVLNAMAARENGARILTRTQCVNATRVGGHWLIELRNALKKSTLTLTAKAIVNATGPWTVSCINRTLKLSSEGRIRLVKGSHIVVPKLYEGAHAYLLQNPDRRVVFAMPYQNKFTLIGTTEISYEGDPNQAAISNTEINYLCDTINQYFSTKLSGHEVVWSYAGVRPLYDDHSNNASKISREYHLELNAEAGKAPLVSIFGGKITTFRRLAEDTLKQLAPYFPHMGPAWTAKAFLPGGRCNGLPYTQFLATLKKDYPSLPAQLLNRYANHYGDCCYAILNDVNIIEDLGKHFGSDLYEKEILYLIKNEYAQTVDDLIWRRTKMGLFLSPEEVETLKNYLNTDN